MERHTSSSSRWNRYKNEGNRKDQESSRELNFRRMDHDGRERSRSRSPDRSGRYSPDGRSRSRRTPDRRQGRHSPDRRQARYSPDRRQARYSPDRRQARYSLDRRQARYSPDRRQARYSPDRRQGRHSPDRRQARHSPDRRQARHSPDRRQARHSPDRRHIRQSPDRRQNRQSPGRRQNRHSPDRRQGGRHSPEHRRDRYSPDIKQDNRHNSWQRWGNIHGSDGQRDHSGGRYGDHRNFEQHNRSFEGRSRTSREFPEVQSRPFRGSGPPSSNKWSFQLRSDQMESPRDFPSREDVHTRRKWEDRQDGDFNTVNGSWRGWERSGGRWLPNNWRAGRVGAGRRGASYRGPGRFGPRRGQMGRGIPSDPSTIPTGGYYYEHDDRERDRSSFQGSYRGRYPRRGSRRGGWRGRYSRRSASPSSWEHDCYRDQDSPPGEKNGEQEEENTELPPATEGQEMDSVKELKYEELPPSKWERDTIDVEDNAPMEH